jgi:hypothetical protein
LVLVIYCYNSQISGKYFLGFYLFIIRDTDKYPDEEVYSVLSARVPSIGLLSYRVGIYCPPSMYMPSPT